MLDIKVFFYLDIFLFIIYFEIVHSSLVAHTPQEEARLTGKEKITYTDGSFLSSI